jgi:hypothetical protein
VLPHALHRKQDQPAEQPNVTALRGGSGLNRRVREVSDAGWSEDLIDERTTAMIDSLIATWPVPAGHTGHAGTRGAQPDAAPGSMRELVAAGLIQPGTRLTSRRGTWGDRECEVLDNGDLRLDGQDFSSPSAAGRHLRGGATNGWWFWHLPDGRRLKDLRGELAALR